MKKPNTTLQILLSILKEVGAVLAALLLWAACAILAYIGYAMLHIR